MLSKQTLFATQQTVVFSHSRVTKRKDGIVEVLLGDDVCYEICDLKEINKASGELCSYKKHPFLFLAGQFTSISNEARTWGATEEATQLSKAEAYVLKSLAQKIIANFYLSFNKPPVPTKFFSSKMEAEKWLTGFN